MVEATEFKPGDVVVHPRRPEWGEGVVDQAARIVHQGKGGQRLVVKFSEQGRVTINTAVVPLISKETFLAMHSTTSSAPRQGWLGALEGKGGSTEELYALPDAMTDPFANLTRRLSATLDSYRYGSDARSLIEWASAQTGLGDPLSKYTRHELEQAFPRFTRDRDRHLNDLVRQIKMQGKRELLNEAIQTTRHVKAQAALQRAMRG